MKGNPQVIKVLNEVLRKELTGINQYFVHAKMCKNWGYAVLHEVNWKESIDEMKHADQIVERILFLEGVPNIAGYDKILVGSTVKQQLENDLGLEQAALEVLKPGIHTCLESRDDASRELLEHIVVDEERHIDWIEAQFHQIKEVGYENYLSQQIFKKARRFTFYCLAPLAACARTLVPGISTTANLGRRLYPTSCPRSLSGWFTAPYFQ